MLELTEFQQRELEHSEESPPSILDPATNMRYVLVRGDVFDRIRMLMDDNGPDMGQVGQLVESAMREVDAGDPTLDFYQQQYGRQR